MEIFRTKELYRAVRNTLLLNELRSHKFKRAANLVLYLPHFLSWVIIIAMFFNPGLIPPYLPDQIPGHHGQVLVSGAPRRDDRITAGPGGAFT
jgi:hypothetical protein